VYCSIRNPHAYSEPLKSSQKATKQTKQAMREYEDKNWNKQYEKLVEFKRKHGNCLVPRSYQEDVSLGWWVTKQRYFHNKKTIQLDRKGLLDDIGFAWKVKVDTTNSALWNKQYEKLVQYKRENGHCLVPKEYPVDKSLGEWVITQRKLHSKNTIRLDRKELLNKIGFVWRVDKSALWNNQYGKLVEFKQQNGHCMVPNKYQQDTSLGVWVGNQRQLHSKNKIKSNRHVLLEELGFAWKAGTVAARSSTTDVRYR
jgi:hypothetical protein